MLIGYSFSPNNGGFYGALLDELSVHDSPQGVLVVPEAVKLARRLEENRPHIGWDPQGITVAE